MVMGDKNIEVEIKAHLPDSRRMEELVRDKGRILGGIDYCDTYYTYGHVRGYSSERFRLRRSGGSATVTAKEKVEVRGVEASREHEFKVDDPEAFKRFAAMFGFKVMVEKRKKGRRYLVGAGSGSDIDATVELVEIEGLGDFIEIEVMVESEKEVGKARERISEIMAELGIPESDLEQRPYTLMLCELKEQKG